MKAVHASGMGREGTVAMRHLEVITDRFEVIGEYCRGKSVLDLGCTDRRPDGEARYASTGLHLHLARICETLTGVDIDPDGVEAMRREGFNVTVADVERMDLGRKFDCIVAGELIEHLSNPGLFLENAHRHLKESGHLILTTPNAFNARHFLRILNRGEIKVHAEHTCWYDPKTLSALINRHGFCVQRICWCKRKKWYQLRYLHKMKYQVPRLLTKMRPYFSGTFLVVARKKGHIDEER